MLMTNTLSTSTLSPAPRSMGDLLIIRGEAYLAAARMRNTADTWEWLMEAVLDGTVDLDVYPVTALDRGRAVDLFDDWADNR